MVKSSIQLTVDGVLSDTQKFRRVHPQETEDIMLPREFHRRAHRRNGGFNRLLKNAA
jgi:hypothetical protein